MPRESRLGVVGTLSAVAAAVGLVGCAAPPAAPTDLGEVTLFLFAQYESDDTIVSDGLVNLEAVLLDLEGIDWETFDITTAERTGRQWAPPILDGEDRHDVDVPEGSEADAQLPVAVASVSDYTPQEYAPLVALADQTPIEASTSAEYDREFITDVECFVAGDCVAVETYDRIRRESLIVDVRYEVTKTYRWVELDDGRTAMLARSWSQLPFVGEAGVNSIDQSYNLGVWLPHPRGALRYQVLWSSWTIPAVDNDSMIINITAQGMDDRFILTEEYLAAEE